ncbi:C-type lectin domain family 4 member E [Elysia marginata]|uniref:C-type lectin domain family 4 member E n=1 Tax=Elysia marginata TaxID=1093978 RepID=A0AAV4IC86_9GAST|nr:C-type lectin domain family 4 member E [Elysia marginata]
MRIRKTWHDPHPHPCVDVVGAVVSIQREGYLKQTSGLSCRTLQIGEPWTSVSPIACYAECMIRYPDSCQSVVYNSHTQNCTPGSVVFGPITRITTAIPYATSADVIFYARQPIPSCNGTDNFKIYDICGTSDCLYVSTEMADNFTVAESRCDQMNSRLVVRNTRARFSLMWYTARSSNFHDAYIGLTDLAEEGKFVWVNGEDLSSEQYQYVWVPGEPGNYYWWEGGENCAQMNFGRWPVFVGVNDAKCSTPAHYICERRAPGGS